MWSHLRFFRIIQRAPFALRFHLCRLGKSQLQTSCSEERFLLAAFIFCEDALWCFDATLEKWICLKLKRYLLLSMNFVVLKCRCFFAVAVVVVVSKPKQRWLLSISVEPFKCAHETIYQHKGKCMLTRTEPLCRVETKWKDEKLHTHTHTQYVRS